MKKDRLLAILLAASMLCGMLPTAAFGAEAVSDPATQKENGTYEVGKDTATKAEPTPAPAPETGIDGAAGEDKAPANSSFVMAPASADAGIQLTAETDYAAQVGETKYETLQAAIDAATKGDTVYLLQDAETTQSIDISKNLTLDLGGHTYARVLAEGEAPGTASGHTFVVNKSSVTFTVQNGTLEDRTGCYQMDLLCVAGQYSKLVVEETATVKGQILSSNATTKTIQVKGTVDTRGLKGNSNGTEYAMVAITGNGSNKTGGTTIAVLETGKVYSDNAAIYHPEPGTVTVKGLVEGGMSGIAMKSGILNVQGNGQVRCVGPYTGPTEAWGNGVNPSGAAIQIETNSAYAGNIKVNVKDNAVVESVNGNGIYQYSKDDDSNAQLKLVKVTGGTVTGADGREAVAITGNDTAKSKTTIEGGAFSSDVSEYCAADYKAELDNTTGKYSVVAKNYVAQVATADGVVTKYETLQDAVNAAKTGETVQVLRDTAAGAYLNMAKQITVSIPEGVTVAGASYGLRVTGNTNAKLTITGKGTVKGGTYGLMSAAGAMIVDGVKVEGGTAGQAKTYGALVQSGTFEMTSGTVTGGAYGLAVTGGTAKVSGGDVSGSSRGLLAQGTAAKVEITGGTFTGSTGIQLSKGAQMDFSQATAKSTSQASTSCGIDVYTKSSLVVGEGAVIEGGYSGVGVWDTGTVFTMNGGTVSGTVYGVTGNGTGDTTNTINLNAGIITGKVGVYHPQGGVLNIGNEADHTGPSITGSEVGVQMCAGEALNIYGGDIRSDRAQTGYEGSSSGVIFDGAAVSVIDRDYPSGGPTAVNITGGTFQAAAGNQAVNAYTWSKGEGDAYAATGWENTTSEGAQRIEITQGTFSSDVSDYCVEGFKAALDESTGKYGVVARDYVAQVTAADGAVTKYETLQAAIDAAADGATVELLKDVTNGSGVALMASDRKSVTIDLGGHTYTAAEPPVGSSGTQSQAFHFEQGNTVVIRNGTLKAVGSQMKMLIQNYCDLTLENVTLEGGSDTDYILSCNAGKLALTGVNASGAKADVVALDVMHWHGRYAAAPTVTVNNTAAHTIRGKIDVYCYENGIVNACENGAGLTISGGTFTAKILPEYCAEDHCPVEKNGVYTVISHPAGTHEWGDGVVTKAAACTETGVMTYTCTVCGNTKTETIPIRNHAWGEWTTTEAQHSRTCTNDHAHVETAPHTWSEGVVTKVATCAEAGVRTYTCTICGYTRTEAIPAPNHVWGEWTTTETQHSRTCTTDPSHVETAPHTWNEGVVTKAAACTETGVMTYTCTVCGKTRTEDISNLGGHDMQEVADTAKAPTCTEAGKEADKKCSRCDHTETGAEITALGHDMREVPDSAKAPTCTAVGKEADKKCSRCDHMETGAALSALNHSWGAWTTTETQHSRICANDPTHVETGEHTFSDNTCTVCGYVRSTGGNTGGSTGGTTGGGTGGSTGGSTGGGTGGTTGGSAATPTTPSEEDLGENDAPLTEAPVIFDDVAETDWYYEAVNYVVGRNIMRGMGEDHFGPDITTTRGMIVTILYRLETEPETAVSTFTDVARDTWYTEAVDWGAANGIVKGFEDGSFRPEEIITREQLAAILGRYASFKGYDKTLAGDMKYYNDKTLIADWAMEEMTWAVGAKILRGKGSSLLDPQGTATRAEAAEMLKNFCQAFVKETEEK